MASDNQPSVSVTLVGRTDVGRVRDHNEDDFLILDRATGRRFGHAEMLRTDLSRAVVFAVADGMGGAAAGEVASGMAVERLAAVLGSADYAEASPDQVAALLDQAIQKANAEIFAEARANPDRKGMGTTVTAAVAVGVRVFISQVGDSRGYLLRKGKLVRLTKDQSLIESLIEEGQITEEEAETLGGRNIVLQAVGVDENLRVDTKHWEILRGDLFLLCSDGLSGMVKDPAMETILNAAGDDLDGALAALLAAANEAGGRDNITAVLARFDGEALRAPLEAYAGADKAGAGYAAPPPPDEPNPMKRVGGVLLVLIAVIAALFFALRRTTAAIAVTGLPADVAVTLSLRLDGAEVRRAEVSGGAHRLDGLALGDYTLVASAPGYEEKSATIPITLAVDNDVELHLDAKPGDVNIRVGTPYVTGSVTSDGRDPATGRPFVGSFELSDANSVQPYKRVPSGSVTVTVRRDGFTEAQQTRTLRPEATLEFDFPPLEPILGELRVRTGEGGFDVVVVDARGEEIGRGAVPAAGELSLRVRTGNGHAVTITRAGFEPVTRRVDVAAGAAADLAVSPKVLAALVTFVGKPGGIVRIERAVDGGWEPFDQPKRISDTGVTRPVEMPPGRYRLTCNGQARELAIEPGGGAQDVRVE